MVAAFLSYLDRKNDDLLRDGVTYFLIGRKNLDSILFACFCRHDFRMKIKIG